MVGAWKGGSLGLRLEWQHWRVVTFVPGRAVGVAVVPVTRTTLLQMETLWLHQACDVFGAQPLKLLSGNQFISFYKRIK